MTKAIPTRYVLRAGALAALAFVFACGCSDRELVELHPASGEVTQAGKPATGAQVTLHPAESMADEATKTLRPSGVVDASGKYVLSTYVVGDGAPAGEWIVTIVWPDPRVDATKRQEIEAEGNSVPDALGLRFANPDASPWKVAISAGENSLPPIDLSKP